MSIKRDADSRFISEFHCGEDLADIKKHWYGKKKKPSKKLVLQIMFFMTEMHSITQDKHLPVNERRTIHCKGRSLLLQIYTAQDQSGYGNCIILFLLCIIP